MIVPAMNWQEIFREYTKDKEFVDRKMEYLYEHKYRRKILKEKLENSIELLHYNSPNKNQWLIFLVIKNCKTIPLNIPVCIYNDKFGINALLPFSFKGIDSVMGLIKFNPHCIKRYRSRLKLDISEPIKVVEHLGHNFTLNSDIFKSIKIGVNINLYMPVAGGGFLGYSNTAKHIVEMKTFISDELMKSDQVQKACRLRNLNTSFPDFGWDKLPK